MPLLDCFPRRVKSLDQFATDMFPREGILCLSNCNDGHLKQMAQWMRQIAENHHVFDKKPPRRWSERDEMNAARLRAAFQFFTS